MTLEFYDKTTRAARVWWACTIYIYIYIYIFSGISSISKMSLVWLLYIY
jgi:hypothetical protein